MSITDESGPWIGKYILNDAGEPMPERDLLRWAMWYETANCVVARSTLEGNIWIATDFMGLDLNLLRNCEDDPLHYKPVLWETAVFRGEEVLDIVRYSSKEDALRGHEQMAKKYEFAGSHN